MLCQGTLAVTCVNETVGKMRVTLRTSTFWEFDTELEWFSGLIAIKKSLTRTDLEEAKFIRRFRRPYNQSLDVANINIAASHGKGLFNDEPMGFPISNSTAAGDLHRSEFFWISPSSYGHVSRAEQDPRDSGHGNTYARDAQDGLVGHFQR